MSKSKNKRRQQNQQNNNAVKKIKSTATESHPSDNGSVDANVSSEQAQVQLKTLQTLIPADDLEITIDTLNVLAENPSLIKSKACKDLRMAVYEFRNACTTGFNASVDTNLTARISGALADGGYVEARILLAEMRVRGQSPKLGAFCRWVRDLDIVSGLAQQIEGAGLKRTAREEELLVVMDAILRVTGPIDYSVENNKIGTQGPIILRKEWNLRPESLPRRNTYASVLDGSIFDSVPKDIKSGFRIIKTTPGIERKPPNHHPAILYASRDNTISIPAELPNTTFHTHPIVPNLHLIKDVLTVQECNEIIAAGEAINFLPDAPIREEGEENSVLAHNFYWVADEEFCSRIWKRVAPFVPETVRGKTVRGLNRRFRVYRYVPGAEYRAHIDGAWPPSGIDPVKDTYIYDNSPPDAKQSSLFTFLIYLNDEFEAGETTFFLPSAREGSMTAYPVKPIQGAVALFPHGETYDTMLHEGTGVRQGAKPSAKYVIPTPLLAAPGDGDWASAYTKANAALVKLSNTQKVSLVTGTGWQKGPCVGNLAAISSIGFPQLCLQDGPLGVRYAQQVTAFPAGITTGSTWDTELMYARGNALGTESKGLGVHVQLGPVAGPLGKIPVAGRNWEGFSVDPYLSGVAMANTVEGMQAAGVQACAKHYIANEQEKNRDQISSNIDDRTIHELYLWGFAEAVRANVTSVMCSYNKVNSSYACENKAILTNLLKDELDFQGYVVSDWAAQHTTTGSANAGMDMAMPGDNFGDNNFLWGQNLLNAVNSGQVPQSRLDDMATRVLAAWYFVGQDQGYPPVTGWSSWNGGGGGPNVQGTHKTVARQIARDGIVLLKNTNNALPLKKPAGLALIGQDAIVNPFGPNACTDRACDTGTLAMGWGSGTCQFPYLIGPYDAINAQAAADGTTLTTSTTDTPSSGASVASAAATAIVFINADSGEGYLTVEGQAGDRANLDPWHNGNALVQAVAAVNKNTIVVIHSVGPLILETILALPNVVAVVWAGIPGQESGNGLVDVLYGSTAPSGKLPYTIAKAQADYGTAIANGDDNFSEGLYVDYRHFDNAGITPRYEFGFGLSYTTFSYSSLTTSSITVPSSSPISRPGGPSTLYSTVATITAVITNNGTVAGAEVPQLYIGMPSTAPASPPKQLRGFSKVTLQPGQSTTVTFNLRKKDLSYWDVSSQSWILPSGTFTVYVGASSRDIRLTGTLSSFGGSGPSSSSTAAASSSTTSRTATTTTISTTTTTTTATIRSTTTTTTSSSSPPAGTGSPLWGQCGGQGWTGPTTCASGSCTYSNPYYSQCLP
ncbi:hypothetical protein B7463_g1094, partial [Scytalidium lignicola]